MSERMPRGKKGDDVSRRSFLSTFLAAGGMAGGATLLGRALEKKKGVILTPTPEKAPVGLERDCDLGKLAGRKIRGLGAKYLGWRDSKLSLPKKLERVRFDTNLKALWDEKLDAFPSEVNRMYGNYSVADYQHLLERGEEESTTLEAFVNECDQRVFEIQKALEDGEAQGKGWVQIKKLYALSDPIASALRDIALRIDGNALVAYSMTEIMSSGLNAKLDAELYDVILRNAGAAFINRLPSLYDGELSVGGYQLTPRARGIFFMNKILPEELQVPEDLTDFKSSADHHRAAFLFALHNLATAARDIPPEGTVTEKFKNLPQEVLAEFIAASHHQPTAAHQALTRYLGDSEGKKTFQNFCSPELATYAKRTTENGEALREFQRG